MNYMYVAVIIFILFLILAIYVSRGFLTSPNTIFTSSILAMLILSAIFEDYLDYTLNIKTFFLFIFCGIVFLIAEFLNATYYSRKNKVGKINKCPININRSYYILIFCVIMLACLIAFWTIWVNTNGTFSERMVEFKRLQLSNGSKKISMSRLNKLMLRISEGITCVIAYIAAFNLIVCKRTFLSEIKNFILMGVFMIASSIGYGARQTAIETIIFFILCCLTIAFQNISSVKDRKEIKKLGLKSLIVVFVIANVFYNSASLVGRQIAKTSVWRYIASYFCGGLYYLNLHINSPLKSVYWGEYSFSDIYAFLTARFGIFADAASSYKEFERFGNTVTILGDWYFDFGFIGTCIMAFICSAIFSRYFYRYVVNPKSKNYHFQNILYCKLAISLVWAAYDDRIRIIFSTKMIFIILIIYLFYCMLIRKKFVIVVHH